MGRVGELVDGRPRALVRRRRGSTRSTAPSGQAWEQTSRVLDRLAHLDDIGPPVTRAEFRTTFAAELDVTPGRHGTIGDGVHVSTLAGAAGLDVDVVVVLGAAEGLLPPGPTSDPLLGDHERRLAGLASSDELTGLVHRQFLAAVTTTPQALVTVPRGDLRATATRHRVTLARSRCSTAPPTRVVDSHAQASPPRRSRPPRPSTACRALWTRVRAGADVRTLDATASDAVLRRALALRDARASDRFTAYDGNVDGHDVGPLPRRVSPTRIEAWPACPHAYFVRYVLGVQPIEEPESIETLSRARPRRGAARGHRPAPRRGPERTARRHPAPTGWGDEHRERAAAGRRGGRRPPRGARPHRP